MTTVPTESGAWAGGSPVTVVIPFSEAGAAGTYTATVPIPARSQIIDVMWTNTALWGAGTSATLNVGDAALASGYMNGVDVKVTPALVDKAVNASAGTIGAYTGTPFYPSADVITATVVTVGTTSSVGRSYLTVVYVPGVPVANIAVKS